MRRTLLVLSFVSATLLASSASADLPPGPPPSYDTPSTPSYDTPSYDAPSYDTPGETSAFERGRMVGRVVGFVGGLVCCVGVPAAALVAALVLSQRKKKQQNG